MTNPDWSKYRNAETIEFLQLLIKASKAYNLANLKLEASFTPLTVTFANMEEMFNISKGSAITQEIVALDEERDQDIRALEKGVAFYQLHFQKELRGAADRIDRVIKNYGNNIDRMKYAIETATLRNLYKDLTEDPETLLAINKLSLIEVINHMNDTNEAFETQYLKRNKETAGDTNASFNVLKIQAVAEYKLFAKTLDSLAFISEEVAYNSFLNELENLVGDFNRGSRQSKKETEEVVIDQNTTTLEEEEA